MGILGIIAKKAPGGLTKVVKKLGKKIVKKQAKQATIKGAIRTIKSTAPKATTKTYSLGTGIYAGADARPAVIRAEKAARKLKNRVKTGLKVLAGLTTAGGIAGLIGKKKKKK